MKNSLYIEIGFYITSPGEAQELLRALSGISGYQITMSPRFSVITEILNDMREVANDNDIAI